MGEHRKLETKHMRVEARVERSEVDGGVQVVAAVFVTGLGPGGPKFSWTDGIKQRLVAAIEDSLVALEARTRQEGHADVGS